MEQIKLLREQTGAGMVDCKKALDEANGNVEKAIEILRKNGIAKAVKRTDRDTCQGVVKLAVNEANNEGYIVEVNAETDFVVRNQQFQDFATQVLELIKQVKPVNVEALMATTMSDGNIVKDNLSNLSGVIGEKLDIKRCEVLSSNGTVAAYSHAGGSIGVLVALDTADKAELAQSVAMQVAAASPKYINPEEVDTTELDKEKDIYREQLLKEGKPADMIEKILVGKVSKYYEEVCLIKQEYIKDDKQKVENILNGVKVEKFVRYSL